VAEDLVGLGVVVVALPRPRLSRLLLEKSLRRIPGVNFTNILRAAFLTIFFSHKITKPNYN